MVSSIVFLDSCKKKKFQFFFNAKNCKINNKNNNNKIKNVLHKNGKGVLRCYCVVGRQIDNGKECIQQAFCTQGVRAYAELGSLQVFIAMV